MLLLSQDYGKHLLGVEDLLQKHALVEADIAIQADRVKAVTTNANKHSASNSGEQRGPFLSSEFDLNSSIFFHLITRSLVPPIGVLLNFPFLPVQATSPVTLRSSRTGWPTLSSATRS